MKQVFLFLLAALILLMIFLLMKPVVIPDDVEPTEDSTEVVIDPPAEDTVQVVPVDTVDTDPPEQPDDVPDEPADPPEEPVEYEQRFADVCARAIRRGVVGADVLSSYTKQCRLANPNVTF